MFLLFVPHESVKSREEHFEATYSSYQQKSTGFGSPQINKAKLGVLEWLGEWRLPGVHFHTSETVL